MAKVLCRLLFRVEPWLMVDVFLIGVLVSLIKIASLADIGMGTSFWAFCVYTVLVVKCISMVDKSWLWGHFIPAIELSNVKEGDTHHNHNHIGCHTCHQLNPIEAKNTNTAFVVKALFTNTTPQTTYKKLGRFCLLQSFSISLQTSTL